MKKGYLRLLWFKLRSKFSLTMIVRVFFGDISYLNARHFIMR